MIDKDRAKIVRDVLYALLLLVVIGYYSYDFLKLVGLAGGEGDGS